MIFEQPLTGIQSKEADLYAIHTMGIPGLQLMENASRGVAEEIMVCHGRETGILSVCGVGNNGADGLCICAILAEQGYPTAAIVYGNTEKATEEFRYQRERAEEKGTELFYYGEAKDGWKTWPVTEEQEKTISDRKPFVLVDALFGVGLNRPVREDYQKLMREMEEMAKMALEVIAVDLPSGISADTGEVMGMAIRADRTITFGCRKTGLLLKEGESFAGYVKVIDIGIPEEAYQHAYRTV